MPSIEQARTWYSQADPVHNFDHVLRVYRMAEHLAQGIPNVDMEILRAAALLHDAEGSAPGGDGSNRTTHHLSSAEFAAQVLQSEGWTDEHIAAVQHCIRAHRFRDRSEPPATLEAKLLFDADKLDVLGAIGAVRTIVYAVLDGQPVFAVPSDHFMQTGEKEPGEPHSSYHEFLFKLSKIKDRLYTPAAIAMAEARHQYLAGFFERLRAEFQGEM